MAEEVEIEELVRRARRGEGAATEALLRRGASTAFAAVSRVVPDADTAADLSQEALLIAWQRLDQLRCAALFLPWVGRIAANRARMWHRHRVVQLSFVPLNEEQAAPEAEPPERLRLGLRQALVGLSQTQRQAVVYHYFKGYSYSQTADLLDTRTATVRSRLQKARGRLKKEIDRMEKSVGEKKVRREAYDLEARDLEAIHWAARCASDDPARPTLQGVYLDAGGRVVGCDGARLVCRHSRGLEALAAPVLLGGICGKELPRGPGGVLEIDAGEARLRTAAGEMVLPVLEEPYVKYEQVVPQDWQFKLSVEVGVLAEMLQGIEPHLDEAHQPTDDTWGYTPLIEIGVEADTLSMRTASDMGFYWEDGEGKHRGVNDGMPVALRPPTALRADWAFCNSATIETTGAIPGDGFYVGANHRFLRDALVALQPAEEDRVEVRFCQAGPPWRPLVLELASRPGDYSLLMPTRLQVPQEE